MLNIHCNTPTPQIYSKSYSVTELNLNKAPTNNATCTFPPGAYRISCIFFPSYAGFSP